MRGQAPQRFELERVRDRRRQHRDAEARGQHAGSSQVGTALGDPGRHDQNRCDRHGERKPGPARESAADARAQQDVGGPAAAGHEREDHAGRVQAAAAGSREQQDPADGEQRPDQVEPPPRPEHRDR